MKSQNNVLSFAALLAAFLFVGAAVTPSYGQDQGDKKQDEKKQGEKKQDDKKQDDQEEINIPALMAEANQLRGTGEFEKAAEIYKKVTTAAEDNAMAWHLYGYCVHAMGKLDEAIKLHEKAASFEQVKGISYYNLGCAYALKEETEKALEYLTKSADAGFTSQQVMQDSDLKSLHENEEFKKVAARLMGDDGDDDDDDDDGGRR